MSRLPFSVSRRGRARHSVRAAVVNPNASVGKRAAGIFSTGIARRLAVVATAAPQRPNARSPACWWQRPETVIF